MKNKKKTDGFEFELVETKKDKDNQAIPEEKPEEIKNDEVINNNPEINKPKVEEKKDNTVDKEKEPVPVKEEKKIEPKVEEKPKEEKKVEPKAEEPKKEEVKIEPKKEEDKIEPKKEEVIIMPIKEKTSSIREYLKSLINNEMSADQLDKHQSVLAELDEIDKEDTANLQEITSCKDKIVSLVKSQGTATPPKDTVEKEPRSLEEIAQAIMGGN